MKKPFPHYRCIDATDDGCYAWQCLACKDKWEARTFPKTYCPSCGIKFLGCHEPNERKSDRYLSSDKRHDDTKRWFLMVRRIIPGQTIEAYSGFAHFQQWTPIWVEFEAKAALYWLRRHQRAQELCQAELALDDYFRHALEFKNEFKLEYLPGPSDITHCGWVDSPHRYHD